MQGHRVPGDRIYILSTAAPSPRPSRRSRVAQGVSQVGGSGALASPERGPLVEPFSALRSGRPVGSARRPVRRAVRRGRRTRGGAGGGLFLPRTWQRAAARRASRASAVREIDSIKSRGPQARAPLLYTVVVCIYFGAGENRRPNSPALGSSELRTRHKARTTNVTPSPPQDDAKSTGRPGTA